MDRVLGGYGVVSVGFGFLMASLAFLRGIVPKELVDAMWDYVLWLTSLYVHIHIYETTPEGFDNQLYSAIEYYLGSLIWDGHLLSFNVSLAKNASEESYELPNKERIADTFQGVTFWWIHYTFKHPATFDSMAMGTNDKAKLMNDLLYGPPGTGKSSLVAAIANFTGYDVYDLELTEVNSNGDLRKLLMEIENKSVIVIEDIDCSIELKKRGKPAPAATEASAKGEDNKKQEPRITLSGLLNFADGLWSSCGSERIVIFTTNHVDQLDPALLRPGRMDFKLELSYATFEAFQVLARTYLRVTEHNLFDDIKTLLSQEDVQITPADVAEILVQNGGADDPETALQGLITALQGPAHKKKTEESPVTI